MALEDAIHTKVRASRAPTEQFRAVARDWNTNHFLSDHRRDARTGLTGNAPADTRTQQRRCCPAFCLTLSHSEKSRTPDSSRGSVALCLRTRQRRRLHRPGGKGSG